MKVVTDDGTSIDLGDLQTAPTVGIIDYSRRVTDDFGVTTVVQRGFARRMQVRLALPFGNVDALQRRLADLRATAAQWIADDRFQSLAFRGFYKEFELDLATEPLSYCTLGVEGLADADDVVDGGGDPAPIGQPSTLRVLQPIAITDAVLASSSVAEDDHPAWSNETTYARGARVVLASTHRVYESLVSGNIGHDPAGDGTRWLDIAPTNRWAMFDEALGTATEAETRIVVTIDADGIGAVALLDLAGDTVRVQGNGYDRTQTIGSGTMTFLDLPPNVGSVSVTIAGTAVSVGTLLVGKIAALGITEASPTAGITDYSRKAVDEFGAVSVVKRAFAKRMNAVALLRSDAVDAVANRLASVRARPSLWIGQSGLESLTIYGFFKEFSIEIGETLSKLSLSIEGLSEAAKVEPLRAAIDWPDISDPAGTKPDNNATNSADPTSPFGPGATVGDALGNVRGNALATARATLNAELARLRTHAMLFPGPNGESLYVLHRREEQTRQAADDVLIETVDLIGAVMPGRSGFVLDAETVHLSPEETLAQRFQSVAVQADRSEASIEDVRQVITGPGGTEARALLTLTVGQDGKRRIGGIALTGTADEIDLAFAVDAVRFEDPVTGQPYFFVDDTGTARLHKVVVDEIELGAVDGKQMQTGAMGKSGLYFRGAEAAVTGGNWITLATVRLLPAYGKPVRIGFSSFARCSNGGGNDSTPVLIRVRRNDMSIWGDTPNSRTRIEDEGRTITFTCMDASVAGTPVTYTVEAKAGSSNEVSQFGQRLLYAEELSRVQFDTFDVGDVSAGGPGAGITEQGGGTYNPNKFVIRGDEQGLIDQ